MGPQKKEPTDKLTLLSGSIASGESTAAHGLFAGEGGTNSLLLRGALAGVARALAGD